MTPYYQDKRYSRSKYYHRGSKRRSRRKRKYYSKDNSKDKKYYSSYNRYYHTDQRNNHRPRPTQYYRQQAPICSHCKNRMYYNRDYTNMSNRQYKFRNR